MNETLMLGKRGRTVLVTLCLATVVAVGLLLFGRMYWHDKRLGFLPKNLFLAWIPLVFACAAQVQVGRPKLRHWLFSVCALGWFFFWPNAAYIVTDMKHLEDGELVPKLFEVTLIMLFAWIGLILSYLSLVLMHHRVRRRLGWVMGWIFVVAMMAVGTFGVCLGRFLRTNSWHVVTQPGRVVHDVLMAANPVDRSDMAAFAFAFFVFSTAVYLMLHALANLHAPDTAVTPVVEKPLS
jgi:uncharacterized membrane protein